MATTIKTMGLILKMSDTPSKDKLLKILTPAGLISAFLKIKRTAGKTSYIADLFTYGEFVFFNTDKGNYLVNSFTPEEHFYNLREDITRFAAAGYFCSFANAYSLQPDINYDDALQLMLNSLTALANGNDVKTVKSIFELKSCQLLGVEPCLEAENKSNEYYFDLQDGRLYNYEIKYGYYIKRQAVLSMYNILRAPLDTVFDVEIFEPDLIYPLTESYLLYHLERVPDSLEFLKGVL